MASGTPFTESLKGSLLLADPRLREPTFFQTVILMIEHSQENGAMGYILNRPMDQTVGELISVDAFPGEQRERLAGVPVFMGGPVSTEHLTFAALGWSEAEQALQYSTHLSAGEAAMYEMEGFHIRAFVGYSGWSSGQLETEMEQKTWLQHEALPDILDAGGAGVLWKSLLGHFGPWHQLVAGEPDDPGLN